MNTLEDKVRAALREKADEIRPYQMPQLRLTGHPLRDAWHSRRHRVSPWLVPLTAAAAVAAVIATSIGISGAIHPARRPVTASIPAAALAKVPPFFVGLTGGVEDQQRRAEVAATATGKTLATISPPKPLGAFDWVSAAADDRTFVLGAQLWVPLNHPRDVPMVFFKVVLNAAGRPGRLTPLPIRPLRAAQAVSGIALSPDGSKLAVAGTWPDSPDPRNPQIRVYDMATGKSQHWVWHGSGWIGVRKPFGQALSWAADSRRLVFQQHVGRNDNDFQVRMLDTTTQPGSLRSTKVLINFPRGTTYGPIAGNTLLTPDGSKIVAATLSPLHGRVKAVEITEFATSTGKPVRVLDRVPSNEGGYWQEVVWTDAHGGTLVLGSVLPGSDTERPVLLGIFDGHRFLPLPAAAHRFNADETVW